MLGFPVHVLDVLPIACDWRGPAERGRCCRLLLHVFVHCLREEGTVRLFIPHLRCLVPQVATVGRSGVFDALFPIIDRRGDLHALIRRYKREILASRKLFSGTLPGEEAALLCKRLFVPDVRGGGLLHPLTLLRRLEERVGFLRATIQDLLLLKLR
jgi:hypothetical protein